MSRPATHARQPRSTATREALYLAGLRRFASEGWRTARIRDIVGDAGQANDSAVNYHFGGRMGLLKEILLRGVLRMEDERRDDLQWWDSSTPDLAEIVRAVVSPVADLLDDDEGRCTLRVIAQVGALAEVGRTVTSGPVADTALQDQLEMLVSAVTARCGREFAEHRVRQLIVMLTAELAVRACDPPETGPPHGEYVADLVDWLASGLARPAPL
ncbi:MAG: TetR/AcrR family transcriptional regulator [Dietzia sp.]